MMRSTSDLTGRAPPCAMSPLIPSSGKSTDTLMHHSDEVAVTLRANEADGSAGYAVLKMTVPSSENVYRSVIKHMKDQFPEKSAVTVHPYISDDGRCRGEDNRTVTSARATHTKILKHNRNGIPVKYSQTAQQRGLVSESNESVADENGFVRRQEIVMDGGFNQGGTTIYQEILSRSADIKVRRGATIPLAAGAKERKAVKSSRPAKLSSRKWGRNHALESAPSSTDASVSDKQPTAGKRMRWVKRAGTSVSRSRDAQQEREAYRGASPSRRSDRLTSEDGALDRRVSAEERDRIREEDEQTMEERRQADEQRRADRRAGAEKRRADNRRSMHGRGDDDHMIIEERLASDRLGKHHRRHGPSIPPRDSDVVSPVVQNYLFDDAPSSYQKQEPAASDKPRYHSTAGPYRLGFTAFYYESNGAPVLVGPTTNIFRRTRHGKFVEAGSSIEGVRPQAGKYYALDSEGAFAEVQFSDVKTVNEDMARRSIHHDLTSKCSSRAKSIAIEDFIPEDKVTVMEIPEFVEIIKEVPVEVIEYVEKHVTVPGPVEIIEKIVEIEKIAEVEKIEEYEEIEEKLVYVPTKVIVDVPKETIRYVPKVETTVVEQIIEVPKVVERVTPEVIQKHVTTYNYIDVEMPMVVAQVLQPVLIQDESGLIEGEQECNDYLPEVIPVDVFVPKPVDAMTHASGQVTEHSCVDIPSAQWNALLEQLNPHLESNHGILPYMRDMGGTVSKVQGIQRAVPIDPRTVHILGYEERRIANRVS